MHGIYIGIYISNKQEIHDLKCILVAWYTLSFGRRKKQTNQCVPPFSLKIIRGYLINDKLNYNFQIFN